MVAGELPWELTDLLFPIVAGLVGGLGGTWIWEGKIKAGRDRRALAKTLAADVRSIESFLIEEERTYSRLPRVGRHFHVLTAVYESLADRLGELPTDQLRRTCAFYRQCDELNRVIDVIRDDERMLRAETDEARRHRFAEDLGEQAESFVRFLRTVCRHAGQTATQLEAIADGREALEPPPEPFWPQLPLDAQHRPLVDPGDEH